MQGGEETSEGLMAIGDCLFLQVNLTSRIHKFCSLGKGDYEGI